MAQDISYRVLARTTRPTKFSQMIGQEGLVQTLKNALESGRMAHAFMLTGIRGVGKTTTARLIARALNCETGPTAEPCGTCPQCQAISNDQHVDVIEIDAASRTGVEDIRELLEGVNYRPVLGRYKIYIIDETHMLSKNAFNALLKTLEEPPLHVKFIFATTEIKKVPLTIISRCQRFDLRRITPEVLAAHFKNILASENIEIEERALELICEAAEGSVRDGLSILEQAIIGTDLNISETQVRHMLGLVNADQLLGLWEVLMRGEVTSALKQAQALYQAGMDPEGLLQELLNIVHRLMVLKSGQIPREKHYEKFEPLSIPDLSRAWQILLKGLQEIKLSILPYQTLEVVLIRLAHVQELLHGKLREGEREERSPLEKSHPSALSQQPSFSSLNSFTDLIEFFEKKRELLIVDYLKYNVGLVKFEVGRIVLNIVHPIGENFNSKIVKILKAETGQHWIIETSEEVGEKPLFEQITQQKEEKRQQLKETPEFEKVTSFFPGAKITIN